MTKRGGNIKFRVLWPPLVGDDLTFNIGPAQSLPRKKHIKEKHQRGSWSRSNKEDIVAEYGLEAFTVNSSTGTLFMAEGVDQNKPFSTQ